MGEDDRTGEGMGWVVSRSSEEGGGVVDTLRRIGDDSGDAGDSVKSTQSIPNVQ